MHCHTHSHLGSLRLEFDHRQQAANERTNYEESQEVNDGENILLLECVEHKVLFEPFAADLVRLHIFSIIVQYVVAVAWRASVVDSDVSFPR